MIITSISKFRQTLPQINRDLKKKQDYVVVVQNSEPTGVYIPWSQWQKSQNNQNYSEPSESETIALLYESLNQDGYLTNSAEDIYSITDGQPLSLK